ncbi:hypothetical protein ACH8KY_005197 [Salmonella enterica subsp. enterica serovar Braenderup]|uniref:hypothetical protein n=1 Tax=Salmonella enterica TaxID=28901 RepID=UPI0020163CDF|nr:hypothetical protein [Salmonella enterica]
MQDAPVELTRNDLHGQQAILNGLGRQDGTGQQDVVVTVVLRHRLRQCLQVVE